MKLQRVSFRKCGFSFELGLLAYLNARKITIASSTKKKMKPEKKGRLSELTKKTSNLPAALMVY